MAYSIGMDTATTAGRCKMIHRGGKEQRATERRSEQAQSANMEQRCTIIV